MMTLNGLLELGDKAFRSGNYLEAIYMYGRCVKAWPLDARSNFRLGTAYDGQGGSNAYNAGEYYLRAIKLDPFNRKYHTRFICCLIDQEEYALAQEAWEMALDLLRDPDLNVDHSFYEEVHAEVATHLIHSEQVQLLKEVLREVPPGATRNSRRLKIIWRAYADLDLISRETAVGIYTDKKLDWVDRLAKLHFDPHRFVRK
jgi:tetratricopeptide (TPR) repeat protein